MWEGLHDHTPTETGARKVVKCYLSVRVLLRSVGRLSKVNLIVAGVVCVCARVRAWVFEEWESVTVSVFVPLGGC